MTDPKQGPLAGTRIVEFAGVGPLPFCAMLLADMGADVVTVDRTVPSGLGIPKATPYNTLTRNRRSMALDLKSPAGRDVALRMIGQADALLEGHRPGVMERLGLGPDVCLARNRKLVFGRMTGWGQTGPLADHVGHDLNYLAMSGALAMIGSREHGPAIPLNLIADLGGGGVYLALGVVAAILCARTTGQGQVVDAAMIDGAASLLTHHAGFAASGRYVPERQSNYIDGGAHWYNVYATKDGRYVSVAPIEKKFYLALLALLGLDPATLPDQFDRASWPAMRERFASIFATRTRDEWCALMEGHEVCFAPVLEFDEAIAHPHSQARESYVEVDGVLQPRPAPRFSGTPTAVDRGPPEPGAHTDAILAAYGFAPQEIAALHAAGTVH